MTKHSHRFVEEYDGLVGFGLDRETDENTVVYYLQKFSDDELMAIMKQRMSDDDLEALFSLLGDLLKKCLSEEEYHALFLKDDEETV
ncbi:MAG: cytoplasmic protein [Deltaproteobacteria bacterium]|nr:cytoplasmic protein [Deltaproteobacteria bacterium]